MNYTSNMGMNMPDENDKFSIEHFNTNTQALDIVGKPDEYKNTKTYAVGDLCIHNNILYKCIIAVETAEEFNAEKWEVTSLCKEEIANKTAIAELNENLTFPDGTGFYPDEQDGQKGYNTSPNRGADTFFPFKQSIEVRTNYYSPQGSGGYHLSYKIPNGKDGYLILWQDYVSTKSESICSVSGATRISNRDGIYNMQYDRQAMQIYSFTGGTTIGISRGGYTEPSGVYVIILY